MTDIGRGDREVTDEDRLPWLEPVEEEGEEVGPSWIKMLAGVLVALLAIGLVIGGVFWLKNRAETGTGDPGVIRAPAGAYKVRPADPGGLEVQGAGDSAYAASQGSDPNAPIDLSGMPEAPITGDRMTAVDAAAPPAPKPAAPTQVPTASPPQARPGGAVKAPVVVAKPKPAAAPTKPVVTAGTAAPVSGGAIQLGAFSTEGKANAAWAGLSRRFAVLAPLAHSVTPVSTGGGTLYRLRAVAGGEASGVCARLKVAGESCTVVGD